jgi:putative membrane protein
MLKPVARQGTFMKISRLGEAPDYRFSLANERTFLAWIRTALGFLAAGVGSISSRLISPRR